MSTVTTDHGADNFDGPYEEPGLRFMVLDALPQEYSFFYSPSDSESKTSIVKVIRSILRENFRRHIKSELPMEKTCKDRLVPLKNRVPVSAKLGENFVSPVFQ